MLQHRRSEIPEPLFWGSGFSIIVASSCLSGIADPSPSTWTMGSAFCRITSWLCSTSY